MILALELDRDIDLALFSRYLNQLGIPHRIAEQGENQALWVADEAAVERVTELYQQIALGELVLEAKPAAPGSAPRRGRPLLLRQALAAPLTVLLLIVTALCYPVTFGTEQGEFSTWLHAMTFVAFEIQGQYVYFADLMSNIDHQEYWRFLSPMFLHFGVLHIVFNSLWLWEVGRRIEAINGTLTLLLIVLVSSLGANFTQYLMAGPSLFGGMSGVVYGLLGFAFVWSRLVPAKSMGLPVGIYIFMFVILGLGFSGIIDSLIPGQVANGAHLGGLVIGLVIGVLAGFLERALKQA